MTVSVVSALAGFVPCHSKFGSGMPHHCCVPLCTSNSETSGELSFHSFPANKQLRQVWIVKIRRDVHGDFKLTDSTKVCSLHFTEHDYSGGDRRRPGGRKLTPLSRKVLNKSAIPSVFPWTGEAKKRKAPATRVESEKPAKKKKSERLEDAASLEQDAEKVEENAESEHSTEDVQSEVSTVWAASSHEQFPCEESAIHEYPCVYCDYLGSGIAVLEAKLEEVSIENDQLKFKLNMSQQLVGSLEAEKKTFVCHRFGYEQVKSSSNLLAYYTGFASQLMFMAFNRGRKILVCVCRKASSQYLIPLTALPRSQVQSSSYH